MVGVVVKGSCYHDVDGKEKLRSLFLSLGDEALRQIDFIGFDEGFADAVALGGQERIGHAAADDHEVDLRQEIGNDFDFIGNLRAADNRRKGMGRIVYGAADEADFLFQQEACSHRQVRRNAGNGGMRPVAAAEGVVYADFSQFGELAGKFGIVLFFFLMIAKVFEKQDFAGLERFGHGFRFRADAVRSKFYGDSQ